MNNPALSNKAFSRARADSSSSAAMSLNGTVYKTLILTLILVGAAGYAWHLYEQGNTSIMQYLTPICISVFIAGLVNIIIPRAAAFAAPIYVVLNGLLLGMLSALAEEEYPGIVINAVLLTVAILLMMLALYVFRIIVVTPSLRTGILISTGAVCLVYLADFVMRFNGMEVPYIHDSGWVGIGISLVVLVIAAMNLLLDFDFIETHVAEGAPKYMEWYAAFGLMVTLIWLYVKVLDILIKLNKKD
ncbi:hypothetical protein DCC85_07705 [Paenibacillus sp. CAA11]|uniref:Bax inhibitor-1/YccA family protein n=1 Tax=Paenibacillus sp. CAA11 TaxID=1532905 RepID=UPI000D359511|nr:Bax inhibitor-1/YccA family protein [Paenibacillus sp. CAA11]AWB44114.1 hypothetical protein DCC85_07705 [Paenibacillus sp. CAA11]